jgi:hypothetical protein
MTPISHDNHTTDAPYMPLQFILGLPLDLVTVGNRSFRLKWKNEISWRRADTAELTYSKHRICSILYRR